MNINNSLPNYVNTPILLVEHNGEKFYYQGDCITGFDIDTGESLMEGLPYKDVNMFAIADEEDFEEIPLNDVSFNPHTAEHFTALSAEIVPLTDPNNEDVLVLYDVNSDVHYFFQS